MKEAEEVCCRALQRWPLCAKALFRRGQARLALGMPVGAAADFREVAILEPTNAQVTKMLRRANKDMKGYLDSHNGVKTKSGARSSVESGGAKHIEKHVETNKTTMGSATALPCPPASGKHSQGSAESEARRANISTPEGGNMAGAATPGDLAREDGDCAEHNEGVASGFFVSGWLDSAERKKAPTPGTKCDNATPAASPTDARPPDARSGGRSDAKPTSRLVSQLTARKASARRGSSSEARKSVAQSEWSRLKAEEIEQLKAFRQRSGGSQGGKGAKTIDGPAADESDTGRREKKDSKATNGEGSQGTAEKQASEWASLEVEEKRVQKDFRAKLTIGAVGNKKKDKTKKRNAVSRLKTEVPP